MSVIEGKYWKFNLDDNGNLSHIYLDSSFFDYISKNYEDVPYAVSCTYSSEYEDYIGYGNSHGDIINLDESFCGNKRSVREKFKAIYEFDRLTDVIPGFSKRLTQIEEKFIGMTSSEKKICFCAIFKNESANVTRCLNSMKGVIDYVSICDTGSTDATVELIKKWGEDNNTPTQVHYEEFRNFGYNRELSIKLAQNSFPDADYILLLDADMVLVTEDGWIDKKKDLNDDCYMMMQKNGTLKYWNIRMVNAKLEWGCVGVTHEYWKCKSKNIENTDLHELWIDDKNDGGSKDDKFERDKRLLEKELEENKDLSSGLKGRYMFYLAQTYRALGDYGKSIYWYQKRIEHGGWSEELYYSQYQIGMCCELMKSYERAAGEYLKAWQMRPSRAESLLALSKMYRIQGDNLLSYTIAKLGVNIPYPEEDHLFVSYLTYLCEFNFEISITAYYLHRIYKDKKYLEEGKRECLYLLNLKKEHPNDISDTIIERTEKNLKYYQ